MAVIAMIGAAFGCRSHSSSPSSAASWSFSVTAPSNASRGEHRGVLGEDDGVVSDGVMVFDDAIPAVVELDRLLREAVSEYGSEKEAARWAATAETSLHVKGEAVDIGNSDATAWLSRNGAQYGSCRICRNEPWHYELRPEAIGQGCPPLYADPTEDPRLQP